MTPIPPMAEWLEAELYRRRTLQLAGTLDEVCGARLAAALMTMDAEGDTAIDLRMTSAGGSLDAAFSLIDTVDLLGVPVRATAMGGVFGPAAFVLVVCPVRLASPTALIRFTEPTTSHEGRADDLLHAAAVDAARLETLAARVARASGRDEEAIVRDMRIGRTFTAQEALEAGLIDEVLVGPASKK